MKIVGLCGFIGSGKGTVADYLVALGYNKISYGDKLKDTVSTIFGWSRELLEGDTNESRAWREIPDEFWSKKLGFSVTPRWVLQKVGTECFRNVISPDIWVSAVEKEIFDKGYDKVVIPDVRFSNELEMIDSLGGKTFHVIRGELPIWYDDAVSDNLGFSKLMEIMYPDVHPSEYKWVGNSLIKGNIYNNSTLEKLYVNILTTIN